LAATGTKEMPPPRPLGVLLLAFLQVLNGITYLGVALYLFAVSSVVKEVGAGLIGAIISGAAFLVALVYVLLGFLALWLARGYVKGDESARRRGIRVAVFGIVLVLLALFVFNIALLVMRFPLLTLVGNIIIIWYLRRNKVKEFFASRSGLPKAQPPRA